MDPDAVWDGEWASFFVQIFGNFCEFLQYLFYFILHPPTT